MSDALGFSNGLNDRWRGAVNAHLSHAREQYPVEAVGLIAQDGAYHACENIEPTDDRGEPTFAVADAALRAVDGGRSAALLHSHTATPDPETNATRSPKDSPSAADMQSQMDMAIPWGISRVIESGAEDPFWFGDQVEKPPLYGREFRHGVLDCYEWIRNWHEEQPGIPIINFPRDADWWELEPEQDLYLQGFEKAGFKRVDRGDDPLPGDVFLCTVHSKVLNHGGVYLGDGLIGHHLMFRLSRRDPASLWRSKLDFLVRHESLPDDWRPEAGKI